MPTVVVLPAPLGPSRPKISPGTTSNETPSTALTGRLRYRLTRSRTTTAAPVVAEFLSSHHALAAWLDLNPSDMAALTHLVNVDRPITQEALRRRLRLSKGAMSALVERMVGAGHVERRPNPEDGRSQLLRLSARSAAGREWHRGQLELRLRAAAGRYDAAQRAAILAFLADVRAAVSATTGRLRAGGPGRAG